MRPHAVSVFLRGWRHVALAVAGFCLAAGTVAAQGTGKVEGHVRDQGGEPIQNAQVRIVNTTFATATNGQGYYFFNNVPPGEVSIQAAFVGYQKTEVRSVRVLGGQTLTQDFALEQQTITIDSLVVMARRNDLVPRDAVTTKQIIDGQYSAALPVDNINSLIAIQPGVNATPAGAISIRGGRVDEAAVYVDGVPTSPGYRGNAFVGSGGTALTVPENGFIEASVTTGSSSAEVGNAQAGIINIETRSGSAAFRGNFGYETDEPFGVNHSQGLNRLQGSFSGPLRENLTFFMSGVLQGTQSPVPGFGQADYPIFVQAGIDTTVAVPNATTTNADTSFVGVSQFAIYTGNCDAFSGSANSRIAANYGAGCQGARLPSAAATQYQLAGKLNYTFGAGNRLFLSSQRSQNQGRNFNYLGLYNPQALTGFRAVNNNLTLGWTQNLARSAERALALDVALSYQTDQTIASPLTRQSEIDTRNPFGGFILGGLDFQWDFDNFPVNDELINNFRLNTPGSRRSPLDLENRDQYGVIDSYRNNAYGVTGFTEGGFASSSGPGARRLSLYKEKRYIGKANLDWQLDRYNRIKLGGRFTQYDLLSYSHNLVSQAFSDAFHEKPVAYDLFVEDRLDLGDVVLVGGLRYDSYDSRASRPADFPRISSAPDFDPADPTAGWVRDQSHSYLSPHIQVSFPVTERTNFRLSYSHAVQAPDFGVVLTGINTDLAITNTNHVYGSDLDFGKSITFEFGIRHAFSDDMVLDISAYNKDNLSNAAGRLISKFDPLFGRNQDIRVMTTADFGNTRGVDVRLDRRIGRFFNGVVAYTYQDAKNTGSNPFTYINFGSRIVNQVSGGNQPPPQSIFPTATSRPHSLTGSFALTLPEDFREGTTLGSILGNVGITALFRYASGTAYTRCPQESGNQGVLSGQVCARQFEGDFFGARTPSTKQLDMRFTKGFALGGLDLTAYLDARNILNFRNVLAVFTTTNDVVDREEQIQNWGTDSTSFSNEAAANSLYQGDGAIDLRFGGAGTAGCGMWVTAQGSPGAPNCVYLIRAEERYGDGDHVFNLAEQRRASDAAYFAGGSPSAPARGINNLTGTPRLMRLGFEVNF